MLAHISGGEKKADISVVIALTCLDFVLPLVSRIFTPKDYEHLEHLIVNTFY